MVMKELHYMMVISCMLLVERTDHCGHNNLKEDMKKYCLNNIFSVITSTVVLEYTAVVYNIKASKILCILIKE